MSHRSSVLPVLVTVLLWATHAVAQSSASFPDPAPPSPPPPATARPVPPPPATTPPAATTRPAPPPAATTRPAPPGPGRPTPLPEERARPPAAAFRPPVLPARSGFEPPAGYRLESRWHSGLAIGGVSVFAVGYVSGIAGAASSNFAFESGWLALPVAGPWIALTQRQNPCNIQLDGELMELDPNECAQAFLDEAIVVALIAVDGLVQLFGASLFIAGVASPTQEWVRTDVAGLPLEYRLAPIAVGGGELGLGLSGRF